MLFCHIPKSAGTSARLALQEAFPDLLPIYRGELRLGAPDAEFLRRWTDRRTRRQATQRRRSPAALPSIVYGHFSYGVHRYLGVPPRYATFLRDPIERVRSLYRHQLAHPESPWHAQVAAGMSLKQFVESGVTEQTNNHACRILAGVRPQPGVRVDEAEVARRARENLRAHFVFVGCVERFEIGMDALGELTGRPLRRPNANVSRGAAGPLSGDDLETVRRENGLDLLLHEWVRSSIASPRPEVEPAP